MRSDEMYYAAFSAALMAGAEPGIAQQLAYQLSYINLTSQYSALHSVSSKPTTSALDPETRRSPATHSNALVDPTPCASKAFAHPINPLNHIDGLSGGNLNEKGTQLGLRRQSPLSANSARNASSGTTRSSFTTKPPDRTQSSDRSKSPTKAKSQTKAKSASHTETPMAANTTKQHSIRSLENLNPEPHKINQAIMLAMMDTNSQAQSKFIAALYFYWKSRQKHSGGHIKSTYWLLMHAIRCYLFGTPFQWGESFAKKTEDRQQSKPMYSTVKELLEHLNVNREESYPLHSLSEQVSYYPCNQQVQCIMLGLAFRPEIMSDFELANAIHQRALNIDKMEDAALWAMAS
ncbi:hypothetical protein HC752_09930 [Vibrio sp. S9_S30]|uniref:hypothetical protein n=1 Tax=Vibrio sp. S9_S30 TaxID=2720226 RepID=UPI00168095C0|nr:hypothetical protein [Vibrio sp. S9_S30]MBD1557261.1 hypothetical protein [Vibrio sp. S9_S30]